MRHAADAVLYLCVATVLIAGMFFLSKCQASTDEREVKLAEIESRKQQEPKP